MRLALEFFETSGIPYTIIRSTQFLEFLGGIAAASADGNVGVDALDPARGGVSWISAIATALLKAQVGDVVTMRTRRGTEELEIIAIRYDELP